MGIPAGVFAIARRMEARVDSCARWWIMSGSLDGGARPGGRGRVRWALVVVLAMTLGLVSWAAAGARVDLNRASVEELTSLPGIGPARARAIVEWREDTPFASVDELVEVRGIGPALLDDLREQVEVGDPQRRAAGETRRR